MENIFTKTLIFFYMDYHCSFATVNTVATLDVTVKEISYIVN